MKKSLMLAVLAVAILLVVGVSSAFADTATITAGAFAAKTATDTVLVTATVNPKLVLQVVTPDPGVQTVDFGNVDPGTTTAAHNVTFTVWSNRTYNVTITKGGQWALMGLNTTASNGVNVPASASNAGSSTVDAYTLQVPWSTPNAAYNAQVLYTVVQN